jgi:hypothetical protein
MHRVLASLDFCIAAEVHVSIPPDPMSAVGVSLSTLRWIVPGFSKHAEKVEMGMLAVHPLGMGHDTGILRPHILVAIPPAWPTSIAASLKATATSACKPQFNAHKTQAGVGDAPGTESLPVTAEPIPYVGLLMGTVCGAPVNLPAPTMVPLIPTQISVWTGMTWGDIIAGIINIGVDMLVSFLLDRLTNALGNMVSSKLAKEAISVAIPIIGAVGKVLGINLDVGIDNPGRPFQEAIDKDGVGSDAQPGVRVFGFGVKGTGSKGGRTTGVTPVGPWNS